MQTLENYWDSIDITIYIDGSATHGNANGGSGIIVNSGPSVDPRVHRQCNLLAGKWCSSFQAEERAVRTAFNWYRRMSPSTRCASFRIIRMHSNAYKICTHTIRLPTQKKTRFSNLWFHLPREGATSLPHGTLAIWEHEVSSWQTWRPKKGQLFSRNVLVVIMTQRNRQCDRRLRNSYYHEASTSHLR